MIMIKIIGVLELCEEMGASVRRGLVAALVRRRVATNLFCCFLFYLFVSFPPFLCLFFPFLSGVLFSKFAKCIDPSCKNIFV